MVLTELQDGTCGTSTAMTLRVESPAAGPGHSTIVASAGGSSMTMHIGDVNYGQLGSAGLVVEAKSPGFQVKATRLVVSAG